MHSRRAIENYEEQNRLFQQGKIPDRPIKPHNYEQLKERLESIMTRDANADGDNGPIMPLGAWHLPTSGETPTGLRHGLQTYRVKTKQK